MRALIVAGAGACAMTTVVASSLDRNAYFYYRHQSRELWQHPTSLVALVAIAVLAETAVAFVVFARRQASPRWKPALVGLVVLVPWGLWISQWVIHSPGFWMIHILWVWLLIAAMAASVIISGAVGGYRALRGR